MFSGLFFMTENTLGRVDVSKIAAKSVCVKKRSVETETGSDLTGSFGINGVEEGEGKGVIDFAQEFGRTRIRRVFPALFGSQNKFGVQIVTVEVPEVICIANSNS